MKNINKEFLHTTHNVYIKKKKKKYNTILKKNEKQHHKWNVEKKTVSIPLT